MTKTKTKARTKAAPKAQPAPAQQVATVAPAPVATPQSLVVDLGSLERVLLQGDLSALNADDRIDYYRKVCATVGLNPLTKPFEYLTLDGKLVLYATRNCADQLCFVHRLSVSVVSCAEENDMMIVRARVSAPDGRQNEAMGVVDLKGQSGKNRANAMMKAETKAKRRAIMSMCGLSFIDETEVEDMPRSQVSDAGSATLSRMESKHLAGSSGFAKQESEQAVTYVTRETPKPTPETQQVSTNPETREEVSAASTTTSTVSDEGEIIEHQGPEAQRKNYAGIMYPMPPEDVIAHLKERRYLKWLVWTEELTPNEIKDAGVLANDFKGAINMVRKYGGAHWKRCKAAFANFGITLED